MATSRPLPDDVLDAAREHVLSELRMFRIAASRRLDPSRSQEDPADGTILMDSALLHARSLYEFMADDQKRDRVVARDYSANWNWKPSPRLKTCVQNIQHFRSHITVERITRDWRWGDKLPAIRDELEEAFAAFVCELPPEKRAHWRA